ncbi:MAG: hypothetical protein C4582_04475 [Desulfobacteraceae bacterium]|jgi:hypothetical protein|nr:MAG: hypothetical protein C4582_04475 [Desulfobacteraceae bacterium]
MDLAGILSLERSSLIKKWQEAVLDTYPADSRQFLKKERDKFSNPVGSILENELMSLFDAFLAGPDRDKMIVCLENILRLRAVQDFSPSQAVSFVFRLKSIVRERLHAKGLEIDTNGIEEDLRIFEKNIDELVLLAFDIYCRCRQKIYELRVHEVQNQVGRLLKRANLVCEIPDTEPDV